MKNKYCRYCRRDKPEDRFDGYKTCNSCRAKKLKWRKDWLKKIEKEDPEKFKRHLDKSKISNRRYQQSEKAKKTKRNYRRSHNEERNARARMYYHRDIEETRRKAREACKRRRARAKEFWKSGLPEDAVSAPCPKCGYYRPVEQFAEFKTCDKCRKNSRKRYHGFSPEQKKRHNMKCMESAKRLRAERLKAWENGVPDGAVRMPCVQCGKMKSLESFGEGQKRCKQCFRKYRERYESIKETPEYKRLQKEYYAMNRDEIVKRSREYYYGVARQERKKERDELADNYIRDLIFDAIGLRRHEIPDRMVDVWRKRLKLIRAYKSYFSKGESNAE